MAPETVNAPGRPVETLRNRLEKELLYLRVLNKRAGEWERSRRDADADGQLRLLEEHASGLAELMGRGEGFDALATECRRASMDLSESEFAPIERLVRAVGAEIGRLQDRVRGSVRLAETAREACLDELKRMGRVRKAAGSYRATTPENPYCIDRKS